MKFNKRGQVFSLDSIFGVVIFLLVFTLFFTTMSNNGSKSGSQQLSDDINIILSKIAADSESQAALRQISFVDEGYIDETALRYLSSLSYEEIKSEFGIKSDFCIFFEDEQGNLIDVSDVTGINPTTSFGLGSPSIQINGDNCATN